MEPNRQKTLDDSECVLAPEQREHILEPWKTVTDRSAVRAKAVYDHIEEIRAMRRLFQEDPLF
jgi:hypothetical protein